MLSRFDARLEGQVQRVERFPESWAYLFGSYRRVVLKRFPYMAVYVVPDDRIDVLAVIAVRRDPSWIEATLSQRGDEWVAVRK